MANLLTMLRLLLTIPVAIAMAKPSFISALSLLALILLAIASDYFDGKIARATNTASASGQVFDHGTDFLFVTSGLSAAAWAGLISPILPVLIIIAFTQYVLDSYLLHRQKQLRMSFLGRWNGVFYFAPLLLIPLARLELDEIFSKGVLVTVSILTWLLVLTTVASIFDRALAARK